MGFGIRRRLLDPGAGLAVLLVLLVGFGVVPRAQADDPSATARNQLVGLIDSVPSAPASSYATLDDTGEPLGPIKIIPSTTSGGYLGVYHVVGSDGRFSVRVGTSSDLVHWRYARTLALDASQPTVAALSNGGYLVALEAFVPSVLGLTASTSHLEFRFYPSLSALLGGRSAQTFDASHTLSRRFEGTPSIGAATVGPPARGLLPLGGGAPMSNSTVQIGFHYYDAAKGVDRNATGVLTNFSRWRSQPNSQLNNAFGSSIAGNIGGRDYVTFGGYPFTVVEAQTRKNDFGSWRVYLYDETARTLTALTPHTSGGSLSFGNPKVTVVTDPAGRRALVTTLYVFSLGNAPGEAGELIYYNDF
jgi:hypothetical protein